MKPPTLRTASFLAVDIALLAVCVIHVPALLVSARAPFDAITVDGHTTIINIIDNNAAGRIILGDRILRWNDEPIREASDLEFLRSFSSPGDTVVLGLEGGRHASICCVTMYDRQYILILLTVGFITWALGVFVLLARPGELAAGTLHWALVCMGVSTILTWGRVLPGETSPFLVRGVFLVVYVGVPSLFLFFTSLFPRPKPGPLWLKALASFLPTGILLVILAVTIFQAMRDQSLPVFRTFHWWYDIFHVVLILNVAAGLISILHSYRRAETLADKKKIEWILWGLSFGPTPFVFLVILPELFHHQDIIPEELSNVFFLLIPISFAIAFVKYHVLDIEVVIKRTTVYAVVLGVVIALYALVVGSVNAVVGTFVPQSAAIAAVGIAMLFEPVRKRVHHWVDRRFFRVQYDFRRTGRSILEAIDGALDESQLGGIVVQRMDEVIPVECIALIAAEGGNEGMRVLGEKGWETRGVIDENPCRCTGAQTNLPAAAVRTFEAGVRHSVISGDLAARLKIVAVFPMADENQKVHGCIAVGAKRSATRFTAEDVDLLMQVAAESGLALQRIRLQCQLLLEQVSARRLEELNRMKSDFVSYVSHELRTPLTSIKMFTEMLRSRRLRLGRTAREYVAVIEGESERLGRMVTTILDSARIEQGVKEYVLAPGDLRGHVRCALDSMAFQLKQHGFVVRVIQPRRPLTVMADRDAVVQAMVNLVANAIKYSGATKQLTVKLTRRNGVPTCSVRDRGRGIPSDALPHLFERFYRVPEIRRDIQGVGLGLPLVSHIMGAHGGTVEVESVVGKGSIFTLVFPASPASGSAVKSDERNSL
jgi:two-component system phosphate regulon sensor histidine kinase PhoR